MVKIISNDSNIVLENKEHKRQLNFEFLRIISMILILLHHYAYHGGLVDIDQIGANKIVGLLINMGGKLGNIIFILISGYFMVDKEFKIKKLLKIIFETIFYSVVILLILLITNNINFSLKTIIKSILPISYIQYGFVTLYVGLYIFSTYINKFINCITREQYKNLLSIGTLTLVILPTIIISGNSFYNVFIYFIHIYLIAGYIRKYNVKIEKRKINKIICITILFMVCCSVGCMYMSQKINIASKGMTYFSKTNSIPIYILGISIFLRFKEIKINRSRLIEILGRTSFSVYLISDNPNFRLIMWNNIFKTQEFFTANTLILILHIIATVSIIYVVCSAIDIIRIHFIEKPIFNISKINTIFEKIDKKFV